MEVDNNGQDEYTSTLREQLSESLNKRFGELIKDDVFLISTFVDPYFDLSYFETAQQNIVKVKVIALLKKEQSRQEVLESQNQNNAFKENEKKIIEKRKSNYVQFKPS